MDLQRRFGGLDRLYGAQAVQKLSDLHVIIAGIGGVGSWCAEALARSGVGHISLVDLDHIAESNINRQIHALNSTLGKAKIQSMAERIYEINPQCQVQCIDDFIDPENTDSIITTAINNLVHWHTNQTDEVLVNNKLDRPIKTIILDCTDQVNAKIAMILYAKKHKLKILVCGGAGGKTDPFSMRAGDISIATHDALLSRMRNLLRRQHAYPKASANIKSKKLPPKMGVWAIWFAQETIMPDLWQATDQETPSTSSSDQQDGQIFAPQGLSCAGYGSAVTITASMGLAVANQAIQLYLAAS